MHSFAVDANSGFWTGGNNDAFFQAPQFSNNLSFGAPNSLPANAFLSNIAAAAATTTTPMTTTATTAPVEVTKKRKAAGASGGFSVPTQLNNLHMLQSRGDGSDDESTSKKRKISSVAAAKKNAKWLEMLEELKSYKDKFGNCIVPRGYSSNTRLASWVAEQRKQYKLMLDEKPTNITQERVDLLNELGFTWNAQEAAWNRHYEDLKNYKDEYGDCLVPMNCAKYPQLGLWVKEQRRHYMLRKQGKHSHMTEDRIVALEDIGFCWDSHEATWWDRYRELQVYKERYGDCMVPTKFAENPQLGTWVHHQRRQYKVLVQEGKPSRMNAERIAALESLGFSWAPRGEAPPTAEGTGAVNTVGASQEMSFPSPKGILDADALDSFQQKTMTALAQGTSVGHLKLNAVELELLRGVAA